MGVLAPTVDVFRVARVDHRASVVPLEPVDASAPAGGSTALVASIDAPREVCGWYAASSSAAKASARPPNQRWWPTSSGGVVARGPCASARFSRFWLGTAKPMSGLEPLTPSLRVIEGMGRILAIASDAASARGCRIGGVGDSSAFPDVAAKSSGASSGVVACAAASTRGRAVPSPIQWPADDPDSAVRRRTRTASTSSCLMVRAGASGSAHPHSASSRRRRSDGSLSVTESPAPRRKR